AGHAEMNLPRARVTHHLYDLHRGRAAYDRIVDKNDALAFDELAVGVVLALHAGVAGAVGWLDEGSPDVVRTDDAELERDARLLGVTDRCRHAAVGHWDDEIRLDWRFFGQLDADHFARFV